MSVQYRLNRLLGKDGKCVDVALDHGVFNEYTFLSGLEEMNRAVSTIMDANPDAVQLTPGQADKLQLQAGKHKPALVLRTDIANVYGSELPAYLFSQSMEESAMQAVKLDAACVVVNLILIPGEQELYHQCLNNVVKLRRECELYAIPLMIEPLVMQRNHAKGGYMVDGNLKLIVPLVRQAVELGADLIKADPCDNVNEFHAIVETASGIPVLARGGGTTDDTIVLRRTFELMTQGAKGIVYGRNIVQHRNPRGMTKALMAIVHEGASVEEAIKLVKET
jgi:DhnA family fructose-bisphosphate aldolase class Ia